MNSFEAEHGTIFHYNSDFTGNVVIPFQYGAYKGLGIEIPIYDLIDFVFQTYIKKARIEKIEDMATNEMIEEFMEAL